MQFTKKTSSGTKLYCLIIIKLDYYSSFSGSLENVFLLNKIDFPAPKKEIEKIISNENFKIVN